MARARRSRVTLPRKARGEAFSTAVAQVVTRFNEIRGMKPGAAREKALKDFYDTLPYLNIQ
jgi:hypothetical protein